MSALTAALPTWVYKRDGRLAPFDADQITLSLFDATESLGSGDAFLARELTEGILYFLAEEIGGVIPTTPQIAEIIVKVVRELGQPALAQAFVDRPRLDSLSSAPIPVAKSGGPFTPRDSPVTVTRKSLTAYTLNAIFSRDLQAARADGLLTLHGLTAPLELAACVMGLPGAAAATESSDGLPAPRLSSLWLLRALAEARGIVGGLAVLDGPEHFFAGAAAPAHQIEDFCEQLRFGARATGLRVLLNLSGATPPGWAAEVSGGPLFASPVPEVGRAEVHLVSETLREQCLRSEALDDSVRVDWHLGAADFPTNRRGSSDANLLRLARGLLERPNLAITFDRPRRPHCLGPGLDRRNPTTLLGVRLQLPELLRLPGVAKDPEMFLKKAGSLTGMAVSAALQKRAYLRDHSRGSDGALLAVNRRFLLARARLVVVPVGLEVVARLFTGRGLCEGQPAIQFARRVLQTLTEVLQVQGTRANLPACLGNVDGLGDNHERSTTTGNDGTEQLPEQVAGMTPCDARAPLRAQLQATNALHAFGERATAMLLLPAERHVNPEELAETLRFAWAETAVQRLTVSHVGLRQLMLLDPESQGKAAT